MKEDEADRDKRRQSAEKQKSAKDSEKKKEKTKNLDRQALEGVEQSPGKGGSLKKNPPARMMAAMVTATETTMRGWRLASTGSSRVRHEATSMPRGWEHQKRGQAGLTAPVLIPLPRLRKVGPSPAPSLPLRQRRAAGLSSRRRGRLPRQ